MIEKLRYDGKRTIITGAASGMGEQTAKLIKELGGEVHAIDIRKPTVDVDAFYETDLSDPAAIDSAVAEIGGPVHALFNCAGLPNGLPGQKVFAVNFLGHRHLTESVIPLMPAGGAIAFISSVGGMGFMAHMGELAELAAIPGFHEGKAWAEAHDELVNEGYSLSKEAINHYVMSTSAARLKGGLRINCVSPGPTDTAMMPAFEEAMGKDYMTNFPKPIGRNSTAEEQAYPMAFLNSDAASYISGHNLMADGGFMGAMMTGQIDIASVMPA